MGLTTKFSFQKRVPIPFFNAYTFTHVTKHMEKKAYLAMDKM